MLVLHPRTRVVSGAAIELMQFVNTWAQKHDLTYIEVIQTLATEIENQAKYALRIERHGTTDKKADEA